MKKILLVAALLAMPMFANAGTFTTGNATAVGIGDQIGSQYDQLILTGNTNSFVASPSPIDIGTLEFVVGGNYYGTEGTPVFDSLPFSFTLDGVQRSVSLAYSWTSPAPGSVDYISFLAPASLTFGNYLVTFLQPGTLSSGNARVFETLQAVIVDAPNVDEASGSFMIALGMFMLAYGLSGRTRI
jgi:hypothetical protein